MLDIIFASAEDKSRYPLAAVAKPVPVMVMVSPGMAEVGEILEIVTTDCPKAILLVIPIIVRTNILKRVCNPAFIRFILFTKCALWFV